MSQNSNLKIKQIIKSNINIYAIFEYCNNNFDELYNDEPQSMIKNFEIIKSLFNSFNEVKEFE